MFKKLGVLGLSALGAACLLEAMVRIAPFNESKEDLFDVSPARSVTQAEWFEPLKREQSLLRRRFQEYEIYGLEPFQGTHIQIGESGYRKTFSTTADPSIRVGFFGGSTMWGGWSRDDFTIPSAFIKGLPQRYLGPVSAINFGQIGYVFSQEVHQAIRLLSSTREQEYPTPQVMVFLDGVCDSLAAMTNFIHGTKDVAGKPWEFEKYRHLFKLGNTGEITLYDIAKKSKAFRLGARILENQGIKEPDEKNIYIQPSEKDLEQLARTAAESYVSQMEVAHNALKANGVHPVFILQPAFFAKNKKSEEEKVLEAKNKHWLPYVADTYAQIRTEAALFDNQIHFIDWTDLFKGDARTLYADVMHYSEAGNSVIGNAIAKELTPLLKKLNPKPRIRKNS